MMRLIADSGSTKTSWMLTLNGVLLQQFHTKGFNPYYYSQDDISEILERDLPHDLPTESIKEVIYYGSGCSTEKNCHVVSVAIQRFFSEANMLIHHDLIGAAHALLGHRGGIACILGTGSNSCLYDGEKIVSNVPSLGYLLGDEGSGLQIGKKLLTDILYKKAPEHIQNDFNNTYHLSLSDILSNLYQKDKPGRFLSSFAPFVGERIGHPYCHDLVASCFDDFIRVQLSQYDGYRQLPVSFVGSVAWHFKDILTERLLNAGINPGIIMQSPAEGLLKFYADIPL
ncbi:MAG: ATPase [Bacteroidales bacterium]|nr:ATPase [Bacteroidales bacterium]